MSDRCIPLLAADARTLSHVDRTPLLAQGEEGDQQVASIARSDLPSYRDLIYPMLRAVASLGGSAQGSEIVEALIQSLEVTPEQLAVTYPGRPKSVLIDRMDWARSYAKLGGALDSPQRGLFVLSSLGKHILSLPEEEGRALVEKLDRTVRAERRRRAAAAGQKGSVQPGARLSLATVQAREGDLEGAVVLAKSAYEFETKPMSDLASRGQELSRLLRSRFDDHPLALEFHEYITAATSNRG